MEFRRGMFLVLVAFATGVAAQGVEGGPGVGRYVIIPYDVIDGKRVELVFDTLLYGLTLQVEAESKVSESALNYLRNEVLFLTRETEEAPIPIGDGWELDFQGGYRIWAPGGDCTKSTCYRSLYFAQVVDTKGKTGKTLVARGAETLEKAGWNGYRYYPRH